MAHEPVTNESDDTADNAGDNAGYKAGDNAADNAGDDTAADDATPDTAEAATSEAGLRAALPAPLRRLMAAREPTPRTRRVLAAVGAVGVTIALVLSLRALDVSLSTLRPGPLLVVALVLTPATMLANAAELRVMAAGTATRPLPWSPAVQVVVLATAANLLPVPGAALVRLQALRTRGATTAASALINLAGAGAWLGTGLVIAGGALLVLRGAAAGPAIVLGVAATAVSAVLVRRAAHPGRATRTTLALLGVEAGVTVLHGARLLTVLVALGVELDLGQALVIGVSAPLSAAAGVFPAGIGLAEALSAALAPLVALPVAAGVAATGLNRVIGLAVTAPVALWFATRRHADG